MVIAFFILGGAALCSHQAMLVDGRQRMNTLKVVLTLASVALIASCDSGDGIVDPIDQADARITITNNEGTLAARVLHPNSVIPVDAQPASLFQGPSPAGPFEAGKSKKKTFEITLVSEVMPPTVEGEVVQATAVAIKDANRVMVSYNMRGAPRLGAIDWITRLQKTPRISASAAFVDSDISALAMEGKYVYAAESTGAEGFPFPAVLERLRLKQDKFLLEDNLRVPLTSYVATSTTVANDVVFATSGNTGHVFAFDEESLAPLGRSPLADARWVAWDKEGGRIVVAQGTPGRLSVFADDEFPGGSLKPLNTFPFPGANVPESKSTVEILDGKAFVASGPEGVQVVCLANGNVIGSVPRPNPGELGLDPWVVVTNAVTVNKDLMFISNGEAGIYVAQGEEDFGDSGCAPQRITVLGKLRFGDLQSANHIDYKGDWLVVAAGLGGVKLVKVEVHEG